MSLTKITMTKRRMRLKKMGRKRKTAIANNSTPSYDELFAALGAPSDKPSATKK